VAGGTRVRYSLPAMSNAVPCAGVTTARQAALHRDAPVEAEQLHRDLALVVYMVTTPSTSPRRAARNTVSDGNGPRASMPRPPPPHAAR